METKHHSEYQEQDQSQSTQQNQSDIRLVPYVLHDGTWTLPDHFLRFLIQEIRDEESFDTVFYEGTIRTDDEFIQLMQCSGNIPVFLFLDNECLGFAWLNGATGNMAFAHFGFKRAAGRKHTIAMGHALMRYWFAFPGKDGPLFEFIFGMMPGFNQAATKYVERLGWTKLGSVPQMLKCEYRGGRDSAEIYYISRFDYGKEIPETSTNSGG